jgi:hemolysin III
VTPDLPKPRLRGVSHQFAVFAAIAAGVVLIAIAPTTRALAASIIYASTLALMFGVSAMYHRISWRPSTAAWIRRLDHSAIFLIIAGTYTPVAMLAIGGAVGARLLTIVWIGAGVGMMRANFWPGAPRALIVLVYLALGWIAIAYVGELLAGVGLGGTMLFAAGGLMYTAGAIIYAVRRPDPVPEVFGYHEIFHLLVIAAAGCHFGVIAQVVRAAR